MLVKNKDKLGDPGSGLGADDLKILGRMPHVGLRLVHLTYHFWNINWNIVPEGSPSCDGDVTVYVWHKPTELANSFLFCSCVYFCLYGLFICILFHKFSRQLSAFSFCSSGLLSALLVFSTIYLLAKVSFSLDIISSDWLGSKHQLTR